MAATRRRKLLNNLFMNMIAAPLGGGARPIPDILSPAVVQQLQFFHRAPTLVHFGWASGSGNAKPHDES